MNCLQLIDMDTHGCLLLLLLAMAVTTAIGSSSSAKQGLTELNYVEMAKDLVSESKAYYQSAHPRLDEYKSESARRLMALGDCAKLYDDAEPQLLELMSTAHTPEDGGIWLSSVLTNHRTCLDGLEGFDPPPPIAQNLTAVLTHALASYANKTKAYYHQSNGLKEGTRDDEYYEGILRLRQAAKNKADIVVARDGSGTFYKTINAAVAALSSKPLRPNGSGRVIVHVKAGVYDERVVIPKSLTNLMFIGDGIDKTIVTGHRNYIDGDNTINTATVDINANGFWARDMTFENTAGPQKHQAVAIKVSSDMSIFYRCSFKGYQDTLYAHSLRQFYRDCHIYGTIDFIFGNAAAVFQNCDIIVRKPMDRQSNMVTAHGRDNPNEPTGFSIQSSRIRPAADLKPGKIKTFLGRPWKRYARVVVWKTDLDGFIDPSGWAEWKGSFALDTLFYGEYMNVGAGAKMNSRVKWPGFHVLKSDRDVTPYTVKHFIDGQRWIPASGVPVLMDVSK